MTDYSRSRRCERCGLRSVHVSVDCDEVAKLREDLRLSLDHLESVLGSDIDMPSGAGTLADAESFLDRMIDEREAAQRRGGA